MLQNASARPFGRSLAVLILSSAVAGTHQEVLSLPMGSGRATRLFGATG
jgi:hypothetical protein